MTTIAAFGLNIILALLLVAALAFGVRLDRRLKSVRDGQLDFAKAVADLDAAAAKAQAGLADLRIATDEATDNLGGRIARAREVSERLEKLLGRAEAMPSPATREPAESGLAALLTSVTEAAGSIAEAPASIRVRPDRIERAAPQIRPARVRPPVDDDLFEDAGGQS